MAKYLSLYVAVKMLLIMPLRGQNPIPPADFKSKNFTIVKEIEGNDTLTHHYDKQKRLIRSYRNRFIFESTEYVKQDTVVVADLFLPVAPFSNAQFAYNFMEEDTVLLDIYSLKEKRIRHRDCKKKDLFYFNEETKTLVQNDTKLCKSFLRQKKLIIEADTSKQKKIKRVEFLTAEGSLSAVKRRRINWKYVVKQTGNHYLKIDNPITISERKLYLKVARIPKDVAVVTKYTRDTLEIKSKEKYFTYDTLLTTVLDKKVYLPPLLDIENSPFKILDFVIPTPPQNSGSSWTYWMGVGEEAAEAFNALEETIPEVWAKPGASKTLSAYTTNQKVILPKYTHSKIKMVFGNSQKMRSVQQKIRQRSYNLPNIPAFQKNLSTPRDKEQYLLLFNQDAINGHTVFVKIIATQIVAEAQEKEIITHKLGPPMPIKK